MDRFGSNVKTRIDEGEGVCTEIHLTYYCGCEYSCACSGMGGEGFESFCDEHRPEAERILFQMQDLLFDRDTAQGDQLKLIKDKIYDLSVIRSNFYDQIMGR